MRVTFTRATPARAIPSRSAARWDRSRPRPRTNGPQSLIRTRTDRPLRGLVTRTTDPSGKLLDAAVIRFGLNRSPLVVRLPAKPGPYHDAFTSCAPCSLPAGARWGYPRTIGCVGRHNGGDEHPAISMAAARPGAYRPRPRRMIMFAAPPDPLGAGGATEESGRYQYGCEWPRRPLKQCLCHQRVLISTYI